MNLLEFSLVQFQNYFLIFVRILSIFYITPIFGSRNFPNMGRIGLSLFIALVIFPVLPLNRDLPREVIPYIILVCREVILGVLFGLVAILILIALQLAGHLIDIQMGYALVNILDPISGIQASVVGQILYIIGILVFLLVNGHHLIITALYNSFLLIPVGEFSYSLKSAWAMSKFGSEIFSIAVKIAMPVVAVLFVIEVGMGFVARTVPQINVFLVGFPLRIALGLLFMGICIPVFVLVFKELTYKLINNIILIMKFS
jgi:flagellar biosynthetic protein FliR